MLVSGCAPRETGDTPMDPHAAVRAEVQEFYDWYLEPNHEGRNMDVVLAERPQLLTDDLRALLIADRKCVVEHGEICNLDFDPFLNAQDTCGRYEVDEVLSMEGVMFASVVQVCEGRRDSLPRLTVHLVRDSAGWQMTDIVYGTGATTLRRLLGDSSETR